MDHTAVKEFKTCPRRYFYRMVLGRTLPDGEWASVFAWGSGLHKFQELLYETEDPVAAMNAAFALFRSPTKPKFDFQNKERFTLTIAHLVNAWKEEKSKGNIVVEAIEQPFMIQFPDGTTIGGRFDQLIKWNGKVWIRDWKTTSKQSQYFKAGLDPNDQAIRYIYAASVLTHGMDEEGYPNRVIDGTLFTAIYNTKTVGPEIYGVISSRSLGQVKAWMREQMFIHRAMKACREEDIWPMHEVSCGFCPYRTVCTQPSEAAMENVLKTAFILAPWKHEEVDQQEHKE